jgi:hypothetical protein
MSAARDPWHLAREVASRDAHVPAEESDARVPLATVAAYSRLEDPDCYRRVQGV